MPARLNYDALYLVSEFLPDRSRLNLAMVDKTAFEIIYPIHLRSNFITYNTGETDQLYMRASAYWWALSNDNSTVLNRIFDHAGDHLLLQCLISASSDGKEDSKPTEFMDRTVFNCIYAGKVTTLNILLSRFPEVVSRELFHWGHNWVHKAVELSRSNFLQMLHQVGWPDRESEDNFGFLDNYVFNARYGSVLRALVQMGANPLYIPRYAEADGVLQSRLKYRQNCDVDLLAALKEYGADPEELGGSDPVTDDKPQALSTSLDAACGQKNLRMVKMLLSIGAHTGGSLRVYCLQRDESGDFATKSWIPTTPLHNILERQTTACGYDDKAPVSPKYLSRDIYMDSLEYNICRTRYQRLGGLTGDTCWYGALFENLAGYVSMVREVVKLLLENGAENYINASVPGKGTPLDQFLLLAGNIRAHHNYLSKVPRFTEDFPTHECKLLSTYYSGERLDEVLGSIGDLVLDAGAVVPWEDYEDDGTRGIHRLQRLLSRVDEEMIRRIRETSDIQVS